MTASGATPPPRSVEAKDRFRPIATFIWRSFTSPCPRCGLIGAVLDPNILDAHSPHGRECHPRISPVAHERLGPARLAGRAISVKNPPTLIISLKASGGFFASQRSAAFSVFHTFGNSRASSLAANGNASQPLASHSSRASARRRPPRAAAASQARRSGCPCDRPWVMIKMQTARALGGTDALPKLHGRKRSDEALLRPGLAPRA